MDNQHGYAVEVTRLPPAVTEKDLYDFFSFSGVRSGEQACTAYVTFKNSYSQETAVLLSAPAQGVEFNAGAAVSKAQGIAKTMLAKGFDLGKDALTKAKAFEESHGISATAAAKVSEMDRRIGLTDRIFVGVEAVRLADQKYRVSDKASSAVSATGRTAAAVATTVVNSSYFSRVALWFSGALDRAAKAAADLGNRGGSSARR